MKKLLIVDSMALFYRSYYAMGNSLAGNRGEPIGAVLGAARYIEKLLMDEAPDYCVFASDSKEETFRHKIFSEYKANRSKPPPALLLQLEPFFAMLDAMNILMLRISGYEADDIIGSLVEDHKKNKDLRICIVSPDKDFRQLITDNVSLLVPCKSGGGEHNLVGREETFADIGVYPEQVVDYLAMTGDSVDNIPGVKDIGGVRAAQLLSEFGSLDSIYRNIDQIESTGIISKLESDKNNALLSRELATIKCDLKIGLSLSDFRFSAKDNLDNDNIRKFYKKHAFTSLSNTLNQRRDSYTSIHKSADLMLLDKSKVILSEDDRLYAEESLAKATDISFFANGILGSGGNPHLLEGFACHAGGVSFYIPLREERSSKTYLDNIIWLKSINLRRKKIISFDIKQQLHLLAGLSIYIREDAGLFDTAIAGHVHHPHLKNLDFDHLLIRELNVDFVSIPKKDFDNLSLQHRADYLGTMARLNFDLYWYLEQKNRDNPTTRAFLHEVEMPLIRVLFKMESTGIPLDIDALKKLGGKMLAESENLAELIYTEAGEKFSINSTKQLQSILFDKMRLHEKAETRLKKRKNGYSTDKKTLGKLQEFNICQLLLRYRHLKDMHSKYVKSLLEQAHPATGRLYSSFSQTQTATGRITSQKPNLMSLPNTSDIGFGIRRCLKAGGDGRLLIKADYSQIELRLLSVLADDQNLQAQFINGDDIHRITASRIFKKSLRDVTPEERQIAKTVNYGVVYGMGSERLAAETGMKKTQAKALRGKYFEENKEIARYIEGCHESAQKNGGIFTLGGRFRPLPEINSSNGLKSNMARNAAVNTPIQGLCSEILKTAMVMLYRKFSITKHLHAAITLTVHDEIVVETDKENITYLSVLIKGIMEEEVRKKMNIPIPLSINLTIGDSY